MRVLTPNPPLERLFAHWGHRAFRKMCDLCQGRMCMIRRIQCVCQGEARVKTRRDQLEDALSSWRLSMRFRLVAEQWSDVNCKSEWGVIAHTKSSRSSLGFRQAIPPRKKKKKKVKKTLPTQCLASAHSQDVQWKAGTSAWKVWDGLSFNSLNFVPSLCWDSMPTLHQYAMMPSRMNAHRLSDSLLTCCSGVAPRLRCLE